MGEVLFKNVSKVYPDRTRAVDSLELEIPDGKLVALVGPSGCGKTTVLRMVAGLESVTGGTVSIGKRIVNDVPPKHRDVAMVFQNYALYPHMSVFENISFCLRVRRVKREVIKERVTEVATLLGLFELLSKRPGQLSGGQRQRVAMGRAIVRQPEVFLLDEPLSNLDAKLRVRMRAEIARLQRKLSVTTIFVTHDQTEAMTLGDLVAVMRNGVLQQVGPPQTLYDRPRNLFVGSFIGSPGMNLVEARLRHDDGLPSVEFGEFRLPLQEDVFRVRPALGRYSGERIALGIRPDAFEDAQFVSEYAAQRRGGGRMLPVVELREVMGSEVFLHFKVGATTVVTDDFRDEGDDWSGRFIARVSARTPASEGERVDLDVDTSVLHFFDLRTGEAID